MKFTGICLITQNVTRLAGFYVKVLGVEAEGNDIHVELKTNGAGLTIYSVEGMESLAPQSMQAAGSGSFTIGFEVDDVDSEYERIKSFGVDFVKHPITHPWGSRSFWFRDPDGNIVNFFAILPQA
jgi:predicted enzyme related to lactoylglutathione lyase